MGSRLLSLLLPLLCSCAYLPQYPGYDGPEPRLKSLDEYYSRSDSFSGFSDEWRKKDAGYTLHHLSIDTAVGPLKVDYYQQHEANDDLIFVFPILGGKYWFEKYMAQYLVSRGFDTAIILRNSEFKNPENIRRIEEVLRQGIVRDRIVMDFFEKQFGKKDFASFGISRGAINAAIVAGVDPRLKYNVLVMGGSNLVGLFKESTQPGIEKYRKKVEAKNGINKKQFFELLESQVRTDPRFLAKHIDARDTLMILSVFDTTVPFKYGMQLRRNIGEPETIFLLSNHYIALLFTQFIPLIPPVRNASLFPFDYVETEAAAFYRRSFGRGDFSAKEIPYMLYKLPFSLVGHLRCLVQAKCIGEVLSRKGTPRIRTFPRRSNHR